MDGDTHTDSFKKLIQDRTLDFLFVAVATAAIVVTTYRLVTVCICNRRRPRRDGHNSLRLEPPATPTSADQILAADLIPARKFQKGERNDVLCAVCLSEFEEGEEVRDLPGCAHAFHAPCIDMWLFSHWTCPICRADATLSPVMPREAVAESMLDFGALEDNVDIIQTRRSSA